MSDSRIITDSSGLVKQPKDPYWDGAITRREVQMAVTQLAGNDQELFIQANTARLIMNLFAEKLGVTKGEIEAYVERKKAEINEIMKAAAAKEAAPVVEES